MSRDEYLRVKAKLANIDDALSEGHLTPDERAQLEALSVALSRQLITPWLPVDWTRRIMLLGIVAAGPIGLAADIELLAWCWPLALTLSPRIIGPRFHSSRRHAL